MPLWTTTLVPDSLNQPFDPSSCFFSFFFLFFFVFLPFLEPLPWHMEVPRLGVYWSWSYWPMPEPQQRRIWAVSATYTTTHSNTGSLTHWARPGIEPATSWFLMGFVNHWATMGTPMPPVSSSPLDSLSLNIILSQSVIWARTEKNADDAQAKIKWIWKRGVLEKSL